MCRSSDPSAARLAPVRSCPHSGQIVTPAEDTEPFPISIHTQEEGLKLASRLLGWGGTAGYKGFPSDRWSGITCVCLISRVDHTLETGPLKTIRKDTCSALPPWFSRFGTREPGAPPAETKPKSSQRLAVQSVRSTLPSTHTSKAQTGLHRQPNQTSKKASWCHSYTHYYHPRRHMQPQTYTKQTTETQSKQTEIGLTWCLHMR